MTVTITAEQRDALYDHVLLELSRFGDLQLALDQGDLEAVSRLGRVLSVGLRLIQEELGWGESHSPSYELSKIPPTELARILGRIRDAATEEYESERAQQEEFRAAWDQTALVRDTCAEVLPALDEHGRAGASSG
jgi:hypothetical protein